MLDSGGMSGCSSLRHVYCGGEALTKDLVDRFFRAANSADLINLYGPTETCVDASHWRCSVKDDISSVLIGRPIDNLQIYILDAHQRPAPIGAIGELFIGGAGLARGYMNGPERTAERFQPDGCGEREGLCLYQTGDLARRLPDGQVECLGRADQQVKIRGQRVELGEVESRLAEHPRVRQVVVLAVGRDGVEPKRLVSYVLGDWLEGEASVELRHWCRERLPEYMVPSLYISLARLPLMPNGKIDRRHLPEPDAPMRVPRLETASPRTAAEKLLLRIWQEVLGAEELGIFDNFFELGGDSIQAIQVIARASQGGLQLTPKQLFTHQTVAALAAVAQPLGSIKAQQGCVTGPVPLLPSVEWFFEQEQPKPDHWNQAIITELRRPVRVAPLAQGVDHLVSHHDALRLRLNHTAEGWQQTNAAGETHPILFHIDLSRLAEAAESEHLELIERIAAQLQQSLNLSAGPIVRVALFDLGLGRVSRLLLIIHHLAVDGVSWRILMEDLQRAYEQGVRGEQLGLGEKTTSYQQWAHELVNYARSVEAQAELTYWLGRLPERAERLPMDYPEGANLESSKTAVCVNLSSDETNCLIHRVPGRYGTQINDALLAALLQAFSQWAGSDSLFIALEGHGRQQIVEDVDLSRTVGWFTSFAPVLLERAADAASPIELLKSVKEQLHRFPHHGIGYGVLRYLGGKEIREKLSALPSPEVSFNYLGQVDQSFSEQSLFGMGRESVGPTRNQQALRFFVLEIDSIMAKGQLRVSFNYSENNYKRSTIEQLATAFILALRGLISSCTQQSVGQYTPSDFPLAPLTQRELDRLLQPGREIEDIYSLTPLQQGILFHSLDAPGSGVYVGQLCFRLHTELSVAAFDHAWQRVVEANPTLRTAFDWEGLSEPLQIVYRRARVPVQFADWCNLAVCDQSTRLREHLAEDLQRGFDLSAPPLMRVALIRLAKSEFFFVWTQHHLLLDGWSLPLVRRETYAYYDAFCHGRALELESKRPFRSYIDWLQHQDITSAETFWRKTLRGFNGPTKIRSRQTLGRLPGETPIYAEDVLSLSGAMTHSLQTLARQRQLTLSTLILGAWALLLAHYAATDDEVFGVVVSGRPPELIGVEAILGVLMNTLPMRVRLNKASPLLTWLTDLQEQRVEMSQYESSPLIQIQEWSGAPRGVPLFDCVFIFENFPTDDAAWQRNEDLQIVNMSTAQWTHYPLALIGIPGAELRLQISYDSTQFERSSIAQMLHSLETILEVMTTSPECQLLDIMKRLNRERGPEADLLVGSQTAYENDQFVF